MCLQWELLKVSRSSTSDDPSRLTSSPSVYTKKHTGKKDKTSLISIKNKPGDSLTLSFVPIIYDD